MAVLVPVRSCSVSCRRRLVADGPMASPRRALAVRRRLQRALLARRGGRREASGAWREARPRQQSRWARGGEPEASDRGRAAAARASAAAAADAPVGGGERTIEDIEDEWGIEGSVAFAEDSTGTPAAFLTHNGGGSAVVQLLGARVSSWKQDSGDEITFSPAPGAGAGSGVPGLGIPEGGIRLSFPQYEGGGSGTTMAEHGFAARLPWDVLMTSADVNPDDPEPSVTLVLADSVASRAMWPHAFTATFQVTLMSYNRLRINFAVRNDGAAAGGADLRFSAAVLGDFEVLDVMDPNVRVLGAAGCDGLDLKQRGRPVVIAEDREQVCFMHGPLHNLYVSDGEALHLEVGTGATVRCQKHPEWREWFVRNHITNEDILRRATSSKPGTKQFVSSAADAPVVNKTVDVIQKGSRSVLVDESETACDWKRHISVGVGRCVAPVTLRPGDDWSAEFVVNVEDFQKEGSPEVGAGDALRPDPTPISGFPDHLYFKLNPESRE